MSSIGTLYCSPTPSSYSYALIASIAAFGDLKLDIAKDYVHHETNKTPAFTKKFASGKIPAFEDHDGFHLFETAAIARYVASLSKHHLLGTSLKEEALVDQWNSFINTEVRSSLYGLGMMLLDKAPYNKVADAKYREDIKRSLTTLEKVLSTRTFLVGERITSADINGAATLKLAFGVMLDADYRKNHPNTTRWYNTVSNQEKIKAVIGETEFIEKGKVWTPPAKKAKDEKKEE